MNTQNTASYEYRKLVSQIKFSLIAPVISHTYTDQGLALYLPELWL